jgi:hypothetical protein
MSQQGRSPSLTRSCRAADNVIYRLIVCFAAGTLRRLQRTVPFRDQGSRGDLSKKFYKRNFLSSVAIESSSQCEPVNQVHLRGGPRIFLHKVGAKRTFGLGEPNFIAVLAIDSASANVKLGGIMSEPRNKGSVSRVHRAKVVCCMISSDVQLGRKVQRLNALAGILMTLNVAEGIRAANRLQSRVVLVADIPNSLQSCVRKCIAIFGILQNSSQEALIVSHVLIIPLGGAAAEPKQVEHKPNRG